MGSVFTMIALINERTRDSHHQWRACSFSAQNHTEDILYIYDVSLQPVTVFKIVEVS